MPPAFAEGVAGPLWSNGRSNNHGEVNDGHRRGSSTKQKRFSQVTNAPTREIPIERTHSASGDYDYDPALNQSHGDVTSLSMLLDFFGPSFNSISHTDKGNSPITPVGATSSRSPFVDPTTTTTTREGDHGNDGVENEDSSCQSCNSELTRITASTDSSSFRLAQLEPESQEFEEGEEAPSLAVPNHVRSLPSRTAEPNKKKSGADTGYRQGRSPSTKELIRLISSEEVAAAANSTPRRWTGFPPPLVDSHNKKATTKDNEKEERNECNEIKPNEVLWSPAIMDENDSLTLVDMKKFQVIRGFKNKNNSNSGNAKTPNSKMRLKQRRTKERIAKQPQKHHSYHSRDTTSEHPRPVGLEGSIKSKSNSKKHHEIHKRCEAIRQRRWSHSNLNAKDYHSTNDHENLLQLPASSRFDLQEAKPMGWSEDSSGTLTLIPRSIVKSKLHRLHNLPPPSLLGLEGSNDHGLPSLHLQQQLYASSSIVGWDAAKATSGCYSMPSRAKAKNTTAIVHRSGGTSVIDGARTVDCILFEIRALAKSQDPNVSILEILNLMENLNKQVAIELTSLLFTGSWEFVMFKDEVRICLSSSSSSYQYRPWMQRKKQFLQRLNLKMISSSHFSFQTKVIIESCIEQHNGNVISMLQCIAMDETVNELCLKAHKSLELFRGLTNLFQCGERRWSSVELHLLPASRVHPAPPLANDTKEPNTSLSQHAKWCMEMDVEEFNMRRVALERGIFITGWR